MTYLIVNVKLGAIKVGITGVDTDRLKTFRQLGWVVHIEKFKTGYEATSVEGAILNWWRIERALPPYLCQWPLVSAHRRPVNRPAGGP